MRYEHIIAEVCRHPWALLDAKFDAMCAVIARCEAGERLTEAEIRERVGERKLRGQSFVVDEASAEFVGLRPEAKSYRGYVMDAKGGNASTSKNLTAVIPVWGILVNRVASLDISETGTGIDALAADFRKAMAMGDVKTIVFDFDSPGGSVYGIDEFAQEIFAARGQGKKLIAQIDPLCASAAYYLASQCDEIVMTPSGQVGSIGVRTMHQDLSKALEMKGVKITHISAGKYKTEGNPTEPLSEEGLAATQKMVDEYYAAFVGAVARGRDVKPGDVKGGFGEGRVVGAVEAKKLKMIDRIETLDETLQRVGAGGTRSSMAAEQVDGSSTTATADIKTEVVMDNANANAAATEAVDAIRTAVVAETERVDRITQLAEAHGVRTKLTTWLKDKKTVAEVQAEILAGMTPQAVRQPSAEALPSGIRVVADEADKKKEVVVARAVRAVAGAALARRNGQVMTPSQYAITVLKDEHTGGILAASNPQDASSFAGGGFMLGDNVSDSIIELLRPMSVVRKAGPATAPLVNGVLTLPKLTGGATATWLGENKAITPSKVTGGQIKATAKKLAALVPISNDLLRYSGGKADNIVRTDMIRAMAQAEDLAFLRGSGTLYTPKGIRNWVPAASVVHSAGSTLANIRADVGKVRLKLRSANAAMLHPVWFMSPRTEEFLLNVADANSNLVYYNEMVTQGTFRRYPYFVTTQIPENLNLLGSSNETELLLADMADVVIADAPQIGIEVSSEAAYDDGAGNLTSAFSNDQTVIRVIEETDLIVRHTESLAVMDEILWS